MFVSCLFLVLGVFGSFLLEGASLCCGVWWVSVGVDVFWLPCSVNRYRRHSSHGAVSSPGMCLQLVSHGGAHGTQFPGRVSGFRRLLSWPNSDGRGQSYADGQLNTCNRSRLLVRFSSCPRGGPLRQRILVVSMFFGVVFCGCPTFLAAGWSVACPRSGFSPSNSRILRLAAEECPEFCFHVC